MAKVTVSLPVPARRRVAMMIVWSAISSILPDAEHAAWVDANLQGLNGVDTRMGLPHSTSLASCDDATP